MTEVNLLGLFLCCRATLPIVSRGGDSIMNVTSCAAQSGRTSVGMAGYGASKAGG
jgi:NAD(P)-dependent dehydrogenase (short-subunit alcohol dehydrogenase family)